MTPLYVYTKLSLFVLVVRRTLCAPAVYSFMIMVAFVCAPHAAAQGDPKLKVAIFGDSLSTGGGTHPNLVFDHGVMWNVLMGNISTSPEGFGTAALQSFGITDRRPPVQLWRSARDFSGPFDWVIKNHLNGLSRLYLDTPQFSWAYMVGRSLGALPENIYIAAEDGAQVREFPRQVDRVLDALNRVLPDKIFVFFSGNDLCSTSMETITSPAQFGHSMREGLSYLLRNATLPPNGTEIYVMSYLNVTQVLTKDEILNHKVRAHGEDVSCRDLRERSFKPRSTSVLTKLPPESLYIAQLLPPNPVTTCRTLFDHASLAREEQGLFASSNQEHRERAIRDSVQNKISRIASQVRSYREVTSSAVAEVQDQFKKQAPYRGLRMVYLPQTYDISFAGPEFSADCFHLLPDGQARIARTVLGGMK